MPREGAGLPVGLTTSRALWRVDDPALDRRRRTCTARTRRGRNSFERVRLRNHCAFAPLRAVRQNSSAAVEALNPVALAQLLDAHLTATRRRMQEAVAAEVHADVREGLAARIEKDEIARLEPAQLDPLAKLSLFARGARASR